MAILNKRTGRFLPALDQTISESDLDQPYIPPTYFSPSVDLRVAQGVVNSPLARSAIINYTDDVAILLARMSGSSFERISALSTPWKIGGAAGLVGAGALTYGAFFNGFSGKDDAANTIQGFPEKGFAKAQREDFGSGWKGLRVSDQSISLQVQEFREKWYRDSGSTAELRRRMAASGTEYGELDPEEMRRKGRTSVVDTSAYRMAWEDADTILLKSNAKNDIAIRLAGIDAPEIGHPGDPTEWFRYHQEQPRGQWALEQARAATAGQRLRIEVASDPKQRTYGRYIGLAYLEGHKEPLNLEMARAGIVASLPYGESGSDIYSRKAFISAEQEAINQQKGIWQEQFFQRYLELSKGLGGRLTFNTFTDLSRLSKNYHLAAAESFMSGEDPVDPRAGRRLGVRLIPSQGRFFSGRGRASNTNEGFPEKGFAKAQREDFGSGWKGLFGGISRKISKFLAGGEQVGKILSPTRALAMSRGKTAEEFGQQLGNVVFLRTEAQFAQVEKMLPGFVKKSGGAFSTASGTGEKFIFVAPEDVKRRAVSLASKGGMSREAASRAVEHEDFLKTVIYHEHLERQVSLGFAKTKQMPTKHIGSQVMIGEGGFAAGTGNEELLTLMKAMRKRSKEESKAFSLGEFLFSKPAKIGDPVNPIEGMKHGGLAEKLRKIFTMFGSKYDLLKGFVQMAGFQKALRAGSIVKNALGKEVRWAGRFGEVHLMKSSFQGQEFEFVRKRLLPGAEQEIRQLVASGAKPEYLRGLDLENEARMLELLGDTPLTPSLYGKGKGEIFMERMPGLRLDEQSSLRVGKISEKAGKELQETLDIMSERGIQNLDVHAGNLSYTAEEGGRLSMYDLGMAEQSSSTSYIEKMKRQHRQLAQIGRKDEGVKEYLPKKTQEEIRQQKVLLANQLRQDQQTIWKQATVGGKNHVVRKQVRTSDQMDFVPTNRLRRK